MGVFQQSQPQGVPPPPASRKPKGRKRAKRVSQPDDERDDDDSDDFDDDVPNLSTQPSPPPPPGLPQRLPGACTYCKRLKMKCEFPANATVCKRCRAGNHYCVVEGRKPRSAPKQNAPFPMQRVLTYEHSSKRELLLAQLRQKDGIIESLLKQLHNPYLATPLSIAAYRMATADADHHRQDVLAWLDRLQSSVRNPGPRPDLQALTLDARVPDAEDDDESDAGGQALSGSTLGDDDDAPAHPALPDAAVPIGLLAKLAISNPAGGAPSGGRKRRGGGEAKDGGGGAGGEDEGRREDGAGPVGVANDMYFVPGPTFDLRERMRLIDQTAPPDILVHGIVTPDDVERLFQMCVC
ncbi:hypothetical protein K488DRAFT_75377, partial [Vararia minispora EC-137]